MSVSSARSAQPLLSRSHSQFPGGTTSGRQHGDSASSRSCSYISLVIERCGQALRGLGDMLVEFAQQQEEQRRSESVK